MKTWTVAMKQGDIYEQQLNLISTFISLRENATLYVAFLSTHDP